VFESGKILRLFIADRACMAFRYSRYATHYSRQMKTGKFGIQFIAVTSQHIPQAAWAGGSLQTP